LSCVCSRSLLLPVSWLLLLLLLLLLLVVQLVCPYECVLPVLDPTDPEGVGCRCLDL
jgi:hypothetical protein